jgi:hypothetical protein
MKRKKRSHLALLRGSATAIEDGFRTYQITSKTEKAAVQSAQAPVNPSDRLRASQEPLSKFGQLCLVMPARQLYDPASRFGRRLGCCA